MLFMFFFLEFGERLFDLVVVFGLKIFYVVVLMENKGEIVVVDYFYDWFMCMKEKVKVFGVKNVCFVYVDGQSFRDKEKFDKIIFDVFCLLLGIYCQFLEVKWCFDEVKIKKIISVQRNMLRNVYENFREGGEMIYFICLIRIDEDEENVFFVINRVGFELLDYFFSWGDRGFLDIGDKVFRVWMYRYDCNSFFIVKLKR